MRVWTTGSAVGMLLLGAQACTPPKATVTAPATPAKASEGAPPSSGVLAQAQDDPVDEGVPSRITKVTVYSDRALVTRTATATITATPTVLRFKELPGWVDEESVRVGTDRGRILDVSVERNYLARSTDEKFLTAKKKHEAMKRRLEALDDELKILEAQRKHIESIKVFSLEKLPKDAQTRDIKIESYGGVVKFVSGALRKTARSRRRVEAERGELLPDVKASQRKLDELKRLTKLEQTTVLVTLEGEPGKAALSLTYATPGATWEPLHEVRANPKTPEKIELNSFAVVTQTTGEDWNHAELTFSTQSSSEAEKIPELEMLALGETEHHRRKVVERTTSFSRAQQKYREQNLHWNRMRQVRTQQAAEQARFEKYYSSNLAIFEETQSRTVQIFQGLQTRGTTTHFVAKHPAIVRSDGRAVRLPIGSSTLQASRQLIAAPEDSLNAAVTLQLKNQTGQPLLPGRVARYRSGAFLGMTQIPFVAKGEDFSVFLSVADQLKLTRKLDRKQSSIVRKASSRMKLAFVTTAQNLSKRPLSLILAERLPVSENSAIRVSRKRIAPSERPDSEGIVRWTVTLAPGEKRTFRIGYQVDYPRSLILDVRRRQKARRLRRKRNLDQPHEQSAPSPARKLDFSDRLLEYENAL